MFRIDGNKRSAAFPLMVAVVALLVFATASFAQGYRYKSDQAWAFGVHGDTQWTLVRNAANPNYVAGSILVQVDEALKSHNPKFVFALGDLSDRSRPGALVDRANFAKSLTDNGIGFFPMRGNHESYIWLYNYGPIEQAVQEFRDNFPQTIGGGDAPSWGAANFSSPMILDGLPNDDLDGLSYSFDFGSDARFVVLDTQITSCITQELQLGSTLYKWWPVSCTGYVIPSQQDWISDRLNKEMRPTHAFVLSHQPPMAQEHTDTPFSFFDPPNYNENGAQDNFYASMYNNDVKYYIGAHDHIYQRSLLKSPDGNSEITEIIASGLSTKFYEPAPIPYPSADGTVPDQWYGVKERETSLAQELHNIGYYVYTVDGPRVDVEYFSDAMGDFQSDSSYPHGASNPDFPAGITPTLSFVKRDNYGYSLNGQQFLVAQGESYEIVQDRFRGTTAKILAGSNESTAVDGNDRPFVKAVNTGWVSKTVDTHKLNSDILSLWGMADFDTVQTDVYVLSMTHDFRGDVRKGRAAIGALNADGEWVNAVDLNIGVSTKNYVYGPYEPEYGLGTYGIDPKAKTAWAVLDYNADFAVVDLVAKK